MNKYILLLTVLLAFSRCGDSNDPVDNEIIEPTKSLKIKEDSLVLHRAESKTVNLILESIELSEVKWSTGNDFVTTPLDQGAFGIHVGETYLYAAYGNIIDSCKVIVKPQYNLFSEPLCCWGENRKYIRDHETRNIVSDQPEYNMLAYRGGEGLINYVFSSTPDSTLERASVNLSYKDMHEASDFLLERYEFKDSYYVSENSKIEITFGQGGSLDIIYKPLE